MVSKIKSKDSRILELDSLRGIASVAVVFYHYFYRYDFLYGYSGINVQWSYVGRYGVQVFFILSGFVIYWTLKRIDRPLDFVISRFSRIYPLYWVSLIITFSTVSYFGLEGREVTINDALLNVLMFHQVFGVDNVDGVYWTLIVELVFYFWIFVVYSTKQIKNVEIWFSIFIIYSVFVRLGWLDEIRIMKMVFILDYIPFFTAGICFFKIKNEENGFLTRPILLLTFLSVVIHYTIPESILFAFFYYVFYCVVNDKMAFLVKRPLILLGKISYPLYLLHQNIGYVVINEFHEMGLNPICGVLVAFSIVMILAYFLTTFVEKPMISFIRYCVNSVSSKYRHD